MTAPANSKTGIKIKVILLKTKRFKPKSKVTKNTVIALLSKNHLKNQDRLNCFSLFSTENSFSFQHASILAFFDLEVMKKLAN